MERIKKLNAKLKNLNKLLTDRHRAALQHSMHLGDKLEGVYADLRVVNESLENKNYITAIKLLCEILEGE